MKDKDELDEKEATLPVRILKVKGDAALVEWQSESGALFRATVPAKVVRDGQASGAVLQAGVPYGLAWEAVELPAHSPSDFARALRAAGIWTKADLFGNPQAALGALQAVYGLDLGALVKFAEASGKEGSNG